MVELRQAAIAVSVCLLVAAFGCSATDVLDDGAETDALAATTTIKAQAPGMTLWMEPAVFPIVSGEAP